LPGLLLETVTFDHFKILFGDFGDFGDFAHWEYSIFDTQKIFALKNLSS